jgi:hypothetical protein
MLWHMLLLSAPHATALCTTRYCFRKKACILTLPMHARQVRLEPYAQIKKIKKPNKQKRKKNKK